ncbi:MAG: hypothetical protein ISF22_00370 [Methanomassiliicoccus sp.]|nr:hypothetical protein [Methanomassiliicoccus sp.]
MRKAAILAFVVIAAVAVVAVMAWSVLQPGDNPGDGPLAEGSRPNALSPADGVVSYGQDLTLRWTAVTGADRYVLLITAPDGSMAPLNLSSTGPSYDLAGLLRDGRYYWTVRAVDDGAYGPASNTSSFTIRSSLDAPVALSPSDGSVHRNSVPPLKWSAVTGAEGYRLRISASSDLSDPIEDTSVNATSYQLRFSMTDGSTYYWQVASNHGGIWSPWSSVHHFTYDLFLAAPVPGNPTGGVTVMGGEVNLTWSTVEDADLYWVQISTSNTFADPVVDAESADTWYDLDGALADNATYYWRVQAENEMTSSDWSAPAEFIVGTDSIPYSFTWTYDGKTWSLSGSVPGADYYAKHDLPRTYDYASYMTDGDPLVVRIAGELKAMAQAQGFDAPTFILSFVQGIAYTDDEVTTGQGEYPRYPVETIVDGGGDCEDKTVLYASLMQSSAMNVDMVLLVYTSPGETGHMAAGMLRPDGYSGTYDTYYTDPESGKNYLYCETTSPNWRIGQEPSELDGFSVEVLPC